MDRRSFLRALGFGTVAAAAAASSVLDIEKLLWVPGEKTIVVPLARTLGVALTKGDIFTIEGVFAVNPFTLNPTEMLQQFVVTADVRSDAEFLPRSAMWPQLMTHGPYTTVASSRPTVKDYEAFGVRAGQIRPLMIGKTVGSSS